MKDFLRNTNVLHIPEMCAYNKFIERTIEIQAILGIKSVNLKICLDGYEGSTYELKKFDEEIKRTKANYLIHLHWPEKIFCGCSRSVFVKWLRDKKRQGVPIVYTMHNLKPHEEPSNDDIITEILELTDGICFFSEAQKGIFHNYYIYHGVTSVVQHPNYVVDKTKSRLLKSNGTFTMLCIGRIRAYKNINCIVKMLQEIDETSLRVIVAGKPDDYDTLVRLQKYRLSDSRLKIFPDFIHEKEMYSLIRKSDAVLLPYPCIWSSGIAVLASNLNVPLIGCLPAMFDFQASDLYGVFSSAWKGMSDLDFIQLVKKSICLGKDELYKRGTMLYKYTLQNSDLAIAKRYAEFYGQVMENV